LLELSRNEDQGRDWVFVRVGTDVQFESAHVEVDSFCFCSRDVWGERCLRRMLTLASFWAATITCSPSESGSTYGCVLLCLILHETMSQMIVTRHFLKLGFLVVHSLSLERALCLLRSHLLLYGRQYNPIQWSSIHDLLFMFVATTLPFHFDFCAKSLSSKHQSAFLQKVPTHMFCLVFVSSIIFVSSVEAVQHS
jgi:hypothetical protein